jgi:tetratricopeptide (TPR) repeat protein
VDDSDGHMASILERLQALHHRACQRARPDPVHLATRLFAWEVDSDYGVFSGAVVTYADVLGAKGVAAYRRRAAERWKTVPALAPGQDDPERYGSRFRLSSIMSALSRMDADVEAQVEVLRRDLSHASNFLMIAETYREAGQRDLALEWAEMGLRAFPERTDSRLRAFVAGEYHRRGRHTDAVDLAWTEFRERPDLEQYKNLKRHADRAKSWSTWRERALAAIRQEMTTQTREPGRSQWRGRADYSILVEIYLWESDLDSAWKEAQTGGCSEGLWLVLADERGKEHPEDALPIYQRHVELTLRHAHNDVYADAVKLLKRVAQLMARMGRERDFARYLESVRATHTRKRNFMRLLSRANWTPATTS